MEQQKQLHLIMEWDLQWFAKDGPGGEKTEPATAKKLREAREDGKVVKSKELTAAFDLIILFLVLKIFVSFRFVPSLSILSFLQMRNHNVELLLFYILVPNALHHNFSLQSASKHYPQSYPVMSPLANQ